MSLLRVNQNSRIYVVAPPGVATGGPELLHQLVYHLRTDMGLQAYMYYYPPTKADPVHPYYRRYGNPYTQDIVDRPENILIVPELASTIRLLSRFVNIQKVIWWLSVNNFMASALPYPSLVQRALYGLTRPLYRWLVRKITPRRALLYKALWMRVAGDMEYSWERLVSNADLVKKLMDSLGVARVDLHLCQSYYAMRFLTSYGFQNVAYLSDYLADDFLSKTVDYNQKEDLIVYNPSKGWAFTSKVVLAARHLPFEPIYKVNRERVVDVLSRAKVYIDFGSHPGKDRLPREAAILGCCVVVGRRGSAANSDDLPIPEQYKFDPLEQNIPNIISAIEACLKDYSRRVIDFETYRHSVRQEPEVFRHCVRKVFGSHGSATGRVSS